MKVRPETLGTTGSLQGGHKGTWLQGRKASSLAGEPPWVPAPQPHPSCDSGHQGSSDWCREAVPMPSLFRDPSVCPSVRKAIPEPCPPGERELGRGTEKQGGEALQGSGCYGHDGSKLRSLPSLFSHCHTGCFPRTVTGRWWCLFLTHRTEARRGTCSGPCHDLAPPEATASAQQKRAGKPSLSSRRLAGQGRGRGGRGAAGKASGKQHLCREPGEGGKGSSCIQTLVGLLNLPS